MKFFADSVLQARKRKHLVCGDYYLCARTPEATLVVLCDGIGSGVYANVSAITCGHRLMEMLQAGRSIRSACEQVAESMHRARTEESPFAAFVAVRILPGGQFSAYAYENPGPIWIHHDTAHACPQQLIELPNESLMETMGMLDVGDHLLLCTDGVTHAGLGGGFATGWGLEGVVQEINAYTRQGNPPERLLPRLLHTTYSISGKTYWDDTSLALISCRAATELCVLTGPPKRRTDDQAAIRMFAGMPGRKVICGSTTTDIASRMLGKPARIVSMQVAPGSPPEYTMEGIDLITEGAVTLNQAMNLLEEEIDLSLDDSPVFRLCRMLMEADAITFLIGGGLNQAQMDDTLFRQLGVKPRDRIIRRIANHLREHGKLVVVRKV